MKTIAVTSAILLSAASIDAAEIFKANNNDALNLTSSWVGGVVPGADDTIVWRPFTTTDNVTLGADLSVYGAVLTNNPNVASLNFGEKKRGERFHPGRWRALSRQLRQNNYVSHACRPVCRSAVGKQPWNVGRQQVD